MKIVALIHTFYVENFKRAPFCIACKEQMEYKGYVKVIASTGDILPKKRCLRYRCDEDSYEAWVYPDGESRTFYS